MTMLKRRAVVPYTCLEMYALVNDVRAYPSFLPWCDAVDVLSESTDEVRATLHLSTSVIKKSFTTCNRLQPGKMIEIRLLDGPFQHLGGFWRFEPLDDGRQCRVSLDLEFVLAGRWLDRMLGAAFTQIANTLLECFCERAVTLYGLRELDRS